MIERHDTPEQLETLARREMAMGRAGVELGQAAWVELCEEFERELAVGTDPADPRGQELVDRADNLVLTELRRPTANRRRADGRPR